MGIDRRIIEKSLKQKGFKKDNRDHRQYNFIYKGKVTGIWTKVSHGGKNYKVYGNDLIKEMKTQLRLPRFKDAFDLLSCPMSRDTYIRLLIESGELRS